MSGNKQKIRSRIKSIQSTSKITHAMELIANAKLTTLKKQALKKDDYSQGLIYVSNLLLANFKEDNPYLNADNTLPKTCIVFCSDMGLCGAYNNDVLKLVKQEIPLNHPLVVIGKKEYSHLKNYGYQVQDEVLCSDSFHYSDIVILINQLLQEYKDGKIGGIEVIYTQFINTLTFNSTKVTLLPLEVKQEDNQKQYDFEPDGSTLLNQIVPMMLQSNLNYYYIQAKTSEYGARRSAMQQSNDNASQLIDDLTLQYNQARQAAITQEITEIISGANAI